MAQIIAALDSMPRADALHILAHGAPGQLRLVNQELTIASLSETDREALAEIGARLAPDADLLIYGCDFGKGLVGEEAVAERAGLTCATIAAAAPPPARSL